MGLPEDVGKHGRQGVAELVWQLAFLGNTVRRTPPESYDNWPEDFFQAHFELDLGADDELCCIAESHCAPRYPKAARG